MKILPMRIWCDSIAPAIFCYLGAVATVLIGLRIAGII